MPKTFANMTRKQRKECRGMWCEYPSAVEGKLAIIYDIDEDGDPMLLRFGVKREVQCFLATDITLRFDLPRACMPDGEPVPGKWERNTAVNGEILDEVYEPTTLDGPVRRFVTEWETAEGTGEPEHPETLTTEAEYAAAPIGTLVENHDGSIYRKNGLNLWGNFAGTHSNKSLAGTTRRVLRWGRDT